MNKRLRGLVAALLGLAALTAVGLALVLMFGAQGSVPVAQAPYPLGTPPASKIPEPPQATGTRAGYPPPLVATTAAPQRTPGDTAVPFLSTSTLGPRDTIAIAPTDIPTPPPPTPWPTPVVTPIPLAQPPYIPEVVGKATQPYRIFLREGNRVWVMNHDGTGKRLVVDTEEKIGLHVGVTPSLEDRIHWGNVSPDGKRLALELSEDPQAWTRKEPFYTGIYLLEVDTGELYLLAEDAREPVWAPDSRRIAYRGWEDKKRGLWVADVITGEKRRVFATADVDESLGHFTWSPDGQRIAFCKFYSLWADPSVLVIDANDKSKAEELIPATRYYFGWPQWSPDGQTILYQSSMGLRIGPDHADNLWLMNADGSEQRQLTEGMTVVYEQWSSDGQWIAFVAIRQYEKPQSPYDLWLMRPDGKSVLRLSEEAANIHAIQWSPDGTQIVVEREEQGIWILDVASGNWKQICPENIDFAVVR